jgi:hypothetical protein
MGRAYAFLRIVFPQCSDGVSFSVCVLREPDGEGFWKRIIVCSLFGCLEVSFLVRW